MSTWKNRLKLSGALPLNFNDILNFDDPINGVASAPVFTNRTKH